MPISDFEMEHGFKDFGVTPETLKLLFTEVLGYLDKPYIVTSNLSAGIITTKDRNDRLDIKHDLGYYALICNNVDSIEVLYHTEPFKISVSTISEAIRLVSNDGAMYMGLRLSFKDEDNKLLICSQKDLE